MKRTLAAAVMVAALAACEPEYAETAGHGGAEGETHTEVTGGADPSAISGRLPSDTVGTIHHPAADGNSGRPEDRAGRMGRMGGTGGT